MEWNKPVQLADLKEGDHIYVHVKTTEAATSYHGIYVGNGEVIHFRNPHARAVTATESSSESTSEDTSTGSTSPGRPSAAADQDSRPARSLSSRVGSDVVSIPVVQFCSRLGNGTSLSSSDYQVRRYRYGVKKLEADYLSSYGTCTTLARQAPEEIVRLAKFYAQHPHDFGEYENRRTSEHFAIFCSTCDVKVDETSARVTPPSLLVPALSPEILKGTGVAGSGCSGAGTGPAAASKGKVAAAATATCGLLAAGAMWGVAPAAVIGGALYASAKYVSGRQDQKQQLAQKKQD